MLRQPERKLNANHKHLEGEQTPEFRGSSHRHQNEGQESPKGWPRGTQQLVSEKTHFEVAAWDGHVPQRKPPFIPAGVLTPLHHQRGNSPFLLHSLPLETQSTDVVTGEQSTRKTIPGCAVPKTGND